MIGLRALTVSVVVVDLPVRVDLDRRFWRHVRQMPLQLGDHRQVLVFVDSAEPLRDAETFVTRVEDHLSLAGKHTTCTDLGDNDSRSGL